MILLTPNVKKIQDTADKNVNFDAECKQSFSDRLYRVPDFGETCVISVSKSRKWPRDFSQCHLKNANCF